MIAWNLATQGFFLKIIMSSPFITAAIKFNKLIN